MDRRKIAEWVVNVRIRARIIYKIIFKPIVIVFTTVEILRRFYPRSRDRTLKNISKPTSSVTALASDVNDESDLI